MNKYPPYSGTGGIIPLTEKPTYTFVIRVYHDAYAFELLGLSALSDSRSYTRTALHHTLLKG